MTNENNRQTLEVSYKFGERGRRSKNECNGKKWNEAKGFMLHPLIVA